MTPTNTCQHCGAPWTRNANGEQPLSCSACGNAVAAEIAPSGLFEARPVNAPISKPDFNRPAVAKTVDPADFFRQMEASVKPPDSNANPFSDRTKGRGAISVAPTADAFNPYAVTATTSAPVVVAQGLAHAGLPWEVRSVSFRSFWDTAMMVLSSTKSAFWKMRQTGGLLGPLGFAICGSLFSGMNLLISLLIGTVVATAMEAQMGVAQVIISIGIIAGWFVIAPLIAVTAVFVQGSVFHLFLTLFGGARQPFETTIRVCCFTCGAVTMLFGIPFITTCVAAIVPFFTLFVWIAGLQKAHETTFGKAAAAVLLPMTLFVCGLLGIAFLVGWQQP